MTNLINDYKTQLTLIQQENQKIEQNTKLNQVAAKQFFQFCNDYLVPQHSKLANPFMPSFRAQTMSRVWFKTSQLWLNNSPLLLSKSQATSPASPQSSHKTPKVHTKLHLLQRNSHKNPKNCKLLSISSKSHPD